MENTLNRQQRRMIKRMNKTNSNRKVIPMIKEFGKNVVNPHYLPSLNLSTKVFITVDMTDNTVKDLINGNNGGVIIDFIDNSNHKNNYNLFNSLRNNQIKSINKTKTNMVNIYPKK